MAAAQTRRSTYIANVVCAVVVFWLVASSITIYNKWVFSDRHFGFHFPISLILITFSCEGGIAAALRFWARRRRRLLLLAAASSGAAAAAAPKREGLSFLPSEPAELSRAEFLALGLPLEFATAVEVGGSNMSLLTLSVSYHTMVKATQPMWVLIFSVLAGLQQPSPPVFAMVGVISCGLALSSFGEMQFDTGGFLYVLVAAMAGGVRWTLSQLLLTKEGLDAEGQQRPGGKHTMHPVDLLFVTTPSTIVSLMPVWFALEQRRVFAYFAAEGAPPVTLVLALAVFCGAMAFVLICSQLYLIQLTSSVTFAVCATAKELLLVAAGMLIFGDRLTTLNVIGFALAVTGVVAFKYDKYRRLSQSKVYERVAKAEMRAMHI